MNQGLLSQDEINALFNQDKGAEAPSISNYLSTMEQDALGEIGNISLGSSTTALSTLLNQRVEITTPTLSAIEKKKLEENLLGMSVAVHVDYTKGIQGKNLLVIKESDAKIIANLMMGGDGTDLDAELTEFHLSAVQEAMNQMMGSAATSMSTIFNQKVDISPPRIDVLGNPPNRVSDLSEEILIEVSFRLKVGNLIDSDMIQYLPLSFAQNMAKKILYPEQVSVTSQVKEVPVASPVKEAPTVISNHTSPMQTQPTLRVESQANSQFKTQATESTNAQKVEFTNFTDHQASSAQESNIDLLYDIPLSITVELGRTQMPIRKILELGPGAVVQLDKLAGEPVDILANQKLIARGEVVVIEENFGVRIVDIISPIDRLTKMTK
ncbi:MAG: flagellar motor switch protein [Bacillales bacterium]|jgi:flagellar motor switch protein FliN/FliY|nr:flagellar motor switch protein [Bacillales bacterium]